MGGGGGRYAPMKPNVYKELGPLVCSKTGFTSCKTRLTGKWPIVRPPPKNKYAVGFRVGGFKPVNPLL